MKIKTASNMIFRKIINNMMKRKLYNKNATIISSNCNGSFIMHDLHMRFNTPTINLYFEADDFIKFVNNLEHYLSKEVFQVENSEYPVGIIDDIKIHFLHYNSFENAKNKWNERKKRVDLNNTYIIMTDRDGFDERTLQGFLSIKYPKVLFSHKDINEKDIVFFSKYVSEDCVGILSDFSGWSGKREYDIFDYISFLNNK